MCEEKCTPDQRISEYPFKGNYDRFKVEIFENEPFALIWFGIKKTNNNNIEILYCSESCKLPC